MDSTIDDLKKAECPMNWDLTSLRQTVKTNFLVEKFRERLEEKNIEHTWKTMNILLFLSYEHYEEENGTFDLLYLRHAEEVIQSDDWLQEHYSAAQHIVYSTWAYTYVKMGSYKSALNVLSKIKPFKEMTTADAAFLLATKAMFYMMYGPSGNSEALKLCTEILKLDQNEAEWWYLKGNLLARMRRLHYRSMPTEEEILCLTKSVEMKKECARYLIHLARSKADFSSVLRHNKTSLADDKVVMALNADVESILRKAASLQVDSSHLICHIVLSFMKLPHFYRVRNRHLTQFCAEKAWEMFPTDPLVNHTVGLYCLTQGDPENAVYFLTEASNMGVFGASFDLCKLKWKECRGYNPVPDLKEIIDRGDQFAASEAHCLIATYYFFVKGDLISTIQHWNQWHHSCEKKSYLITSLFLGQESFDFNSVLYDEVRLELNSTRYYSPEDRLQLEEASKTIEKHRPQLQDKEPWRQRQHVIDKAQMVSRIGRAYPDSFLFFLREQRAKKKGEPFGKKEIAKYGKKAMHVSSKYNGYKREHDPKNDRRANPIKKFGQKCPKPFWRPPRRHRSLENLDGERRAGSGRVSSALPKLGELKLKAASLETLQLVKSYEPKKGSYCVNKSRYGSHESLPGNMSGRARYMERDGKHAFGNTRSRTLSSDRVYDTFRSSGRQTSNDRDWQLSFRTRSSEQVCGTQSTRRPSVGKDISRDRSSSQTGSPDPVAELHGSWRRGENAGVDQSSPKSAYFQSFSKEDQSDGRPSSRASSVGKEEPLRSSSSQSWNEMGQGDTSKPLFRSSCVEQKNVKKAVAAEAVFQSQNERGRGDSLLPRTPSLEETDGSVELFFPSWRDKNRSDDTQHSPRTFFAKHEEGPTSAFFQSWNNRGRSDNFRPSSRASSVVEDSSSTVSQNWKNRDRNDIFRSSSHTFSSKEEDGPTSAFLQSRNNRSQSDSLRPSSRSSSGWQGNRQPRYERRESYTPRGGSFSRGGQRDSRGSKFISRESTDSRVAFCDLFKRLNFRKD